MGHYSGGNPGLPGIRPPTVSFAIQGPAPSVTPEYFVARSAGGAAGRPGAGSLTSAAFRTVSASAETWDPESSFLKMRRLRSWNEQISDLSCNHLRDAAATASPERPKHRGNSSEARPMFFSPARRQRQATVSNNPPVRRANTPGHRRYGTGPQPLLPHKGKKENASRAPERRFDPNEGSLQRDGVQQGFKDSRGAPCSPPAAVGTSEGPRLLQRRTWLLLQHLVDELERKEGTVPIKSDALLQQPEALQQLLQPLLPLLPLKEMLRQLIERGTPTHPIRPNETRKEGSQKAAESRVSSIPQASLQPPSLPRPRSVRRAASSSSAWSAGKPPNSSPYERTSARSLRPAPSPSRWSSAVGVRSVEKLQVTRSGNPLPSTKGSATWRLPRLAPVPPVIPKQAAGERIKGRVSPVRGRDALQYHSSRFGGPAELMEAPQGAETRWVTRSFSTGRNVRPKSQVASRLPPGALEHRRSPKARARAGSVEGGRQLRFLNVWDRCAGSSVSSVPEPLSSASSSNSGDTMKSEDPLSSIRMPPDWAEGGTTLCGAEGWYVIGSRSDRCFTSIRNLGAQPSSPPSGYADEEEAPQSNPSPQPNLLHGSSSSPEANQAGEPGADPSGPPRTHPRPISRGLGHRLAEPRLPPSRRHTAISPSPPPSAPEGDTRLRRQQQSQEGIVPVSPKRERHLTIAESMKRRGAMPAPKGGRTMLEGGELEKEPQKDSTAPHVPRLKELTRARRATTQVTTPRSPSASPRRPTGLKPRPERSPTYGKALGKKDSKSSLKSPRASPHELIPGGTAGRRLSAPPPRRATMAKLPTPPPRVRSVVPGATATRLGSLLAKPGLGRRKTTKIPAVKPKGTIIEIPKDHETPPETVEAPEKVEEAKTEEVPAPEEAPPEPLYPFLRLVELPVLETPIRPLPNLGAMPLKASPEPPPQIDDSVTFMHILERSERLREREKATHRAVSSLCNEGPGTLLLIARWMDTATDTVESNSAAVKEELPWRDVIPPFFVGLNTHRELFSPRIPRGGLALTELRDFLVSEGFIETQEQKLIQLLTSKSLPIKDSEEGTKPPKTPTLLDIYLDYVLAVAIAYLRLRQQPVLLPKITRFVVGAEDESCSTSSCAGSCCPSDTSLDTDADVRRSSDGQEGVARRVFRPRATFDRSQAKRRCWSCLPVREPSRSSLCQGSSSRRTSSTGRCGISCCFSTLSGPSELDMFEATAAQQVRAVVRQMPLLPSEQYLRYLRLAGRRNELEALATWLAGRSDSVPTFAYYISLREQHDASTAPKRFTDQEEPRSDSRPSSPPSSSPSEISSSPSPPISSQEETARKDTTSSGTAEEGEEAPQQRQDENGEESRESSLVVSLYSSPPSPTRQIVVVTPSSPQSFSYSGVEPSSVSVDEHEPTETPYDEQQPDEEAPPKGQQLVKTAIKQLTSVAYTKPQAAEGQSRSASLRSPGWGKASEPPQPRRISAASGQPSQQRPSSIAHAAAKPKTRRQSAAKSPARRVSAISERATTGGKPARAVGPIQRPASIPTGRTAADREPQRTAKVARVKADGGSTVQSAESELADSVSAAALSTPETPEPPAPANATAEESVEPVQQKPANRSPLTPPQRKLSSPARQPFVSNQNSSGRLAARLKSSPQQSSLPKRFYAPQRFPRHTAATAKRGTAGRVFAQTTSSEGRSEQLTKEAANLLTEPQMLAEVAGLCARLSALSCCTNTVTPIKGESTPYFPPDIDEPVKTTGRSQ